MPPCWRRLPTSGSSSSSARASRAENYEGKLIQTGIRSKAAGSIQSYEFEFSVENEALARELMLQGGKTLELHYKEYFGALPWRGFTKFVVDSIITVRPAEQGKQGVDR